MVLSSAAGSALAALGFYALARMVGVLLSITSMPPANWFFAAIGSAMKLISITIPRLDMMGQTTWLVYGDTDHAALRIITCGGPFDRDSGRFLFHGIWRNSYEAEIHRSRFAPSDRPVCSSLTG